MKRKLKVFLRKIKRNIKKVLNFTIKTKPGKKGIKPVRFLLSIVVFFVVLYIGKLICNTAVSYYYSSYVPKQIEQDIAIKEETSETLKGAGFVASVGKNEHEWLYASDTLQFDEVWYTLVENEKSNYTKLSKKEKVEWETNILSSFRWDEFPSTISKSDAVLLGEACGFTESESKQILFGDPNALIEKQPVYSMGDDFCYGGVLLTCFVNAKESVDAVIFGDEEILSMLSNNKNVLRYKVSFSEDPLTSEDINKVKQAKIDEVAKDITILVCTSLMDESGENESSYVVTDFLTDVFGDKYGEISEISSFDAEMLYDMVFYVNTSDELKDLDIDSIFRTRKINLASISSAEDLDLCFTEQVSSDLKNVKKVDQIYICDQDGNEFLNQTMDGLMSYLQLK